MGRSGLVRCQIAPEAHLGPMMRRIDLWPFWACQRLIGAFLGLFGQCCEKLLPERVFAYLVQGPLFGLIFLVLLVLLLWLGGLLVR